MKNTESFYIGREGSFRHILVTIVAQDGGKFTLETPHGTKIDVGFVHLAQSFRDMTREEEIIFRGYKVDDAWQRTNDKNGDA